MLLRFITTMSCKPSKRNRRDFCNFFPLQRVPRQGDALPIIPVNDEALMTKSWARIDILIRNLPFGIPSSFVIRISSLLGTCVFLFAATAEGQIQVDLKFQRLQYIAYEPVVATVTLTNLAGRDIELHAANGESWLGFEVTGNEDQPITLLSTENAQPPLKLEAGQRVMQQ